MSSSLELEKFPPHKELQDFNADKSNLMCQIADMTKSHVPLSAKMYWDLLVGSYFRYNLRVVSISEFRDPPDFTLLELLLSAAIQRVHVSYLLSFYDCKLEKFNSRTRVYELGRSDASHEVHEMYLLAKRYVEISYPRDTDGKCILPVKTCPPPKEDKNNSFCAPQEPEDEVPPKAPPSSPSADVKEKKPAVLIEKGSLKEITDKLTEVVSTTNEWGDLKWDCSPTTLNAIRTEYEKRIRLAGSDPYKLRKTKEWNDTSVALYKRRANNIFNSSKSHGFF